MKYCTSVSNQYLYTYMQYVLYISCSQRAVPGSYHDIFLTGFQFYFSFKFYEYNVRNLDLSAAVLSHQAELANCATYYDIDIIHTHRENHPNYVSYLIVFCKVVYDLHVYFNKVINVCGSSSFDDITPITSHRRAIAFWRMLLMNVRSGNCHCWCPARTNNIRVAASSRRHTASIPHKHTHTHICVLSRVIYAPTRVYIQFIHEL